MEDTIEQEEQKKENGMHDTTLVLGWMLAGLSLIPLLSQGISNMLGAPILGFAILLFMYSKLVGVLEQIRDKLAS